MDVAPAPPGSLSRSPSAPPRPGAAVAPELTSLPTARGLAELLSQRPRPYAHAHPPVRDVNALVAEQFTWGQRVADRFATVMGSWRFILVQSVLLAIWIGVNVVGWVARWDPYPFILLNLVLSFQAAYAAPIIMMSQNRQADKDRIAAQHDYAVNVKAEEEIKAVLERLEYQHELTLHVLARLEQQDARLLATL